MIFEPTCRLQAYLTRFDLKLFVIKDLGRPECLAKCAEMIVLLGIKKGLAEECPCERRDTRAGFSFDIPGRLKPIRIALPLVR